jgi:hypothetical protein
MRHATTSLTRAAPKGLQMRMAGATSYVNERTVEFALVPYLKTELMKYFDCVTPMLPLVESGNQQTIFGYARTGPFPHSRGVRALIANIYMRLSTVTC